MATALCAAGHEYVRGNGCSSCAHSKWRAKRKTNLRAVVCEAKCEARRRRSEKRKAYKRAWNAAHPESVRLTNRRRRGFRLPVLFCGACSNCGACVAEVGYAPKKPRSVFCGVECRLAAARSAARATRPTVTKRCAWCGQTFTTDTHAQRRFCPGGRCLKKAARKHGRHVRRTRVAGRRRDRMITLREVGARDGWVCSLCGDPIDDALRSPHPQSASIDHVIAIANGGTHTLDNVKIAHRICNCRKGARRIAA